MAEPTRIVMIRLGDPVIDFFVFGKAAPAGSKTSVKSTAADGRTVYRSRHARKSTAPWMAQIRQQAGEFRDRHEILTLDGPLWAQLTFWRARPKTHLRTIDGEPSTELKPNTPRWPDTQPDLTKLVRAVEDALTQAEIFKDDARIVLQINRKLFCDSAQHQSHAIRVPGVQIEIGRMLPGCGVIE